MTTPAQKYHQAALAYLVYGLLYLSGALYLVSAGASERSGTVWFVVGAAMVVVIPILIWRGYKWFTRVMAVLLGVRVVGLIRVLLDAAGETVPLPWGGDLPRVYGAVVFMIVAAATCWMLVRAGWNVGKGQARTSSPTA